MSTSQQPESTEPTPNAGSSDAWGWGVVGVLVAIGLLIFWIGWTVFITAVLWVVVAVAVAFAVFQAFTAVNSGSQEDKTERWVITGVSAVVGLLAFWFIPDSSTSPDSSTAGPTEPEPASVELSTEELRLTAHTVTGSWKEEDLFIDDELNWSGSAGVTGSESNRLILVTNKHVLALDELRASDSNTDGIPDIIGYHLAVEFASGQRKRVLRFAPQSGSLDLALLEVDASGLKPGVDYLPLPISDGPSLRVGDDVVAVGSPLLLSGTHTFGRISALRGSTDHMLIQSDAAINPGNSGGPLFVKTTTGKYQWVGVNTMVIGSDNLGFAIDARNALNTTYMRWFTADASGARQALGLSHNR